MAIKREKSFLMNDCLLSFRAKNLGGKGMDGIHALGSALYASSKGTKHFYEALEFLSEVLPDEYLEEFTDYKSKFIEQNM